MTTHQGVVEVGEAAGLVMGAVVLLAGTIALAVVVGAQVIKTMVYGLKTREARAMQRSQRAAASTGEQQ